MVNLSTEIRQNPIGLISDQLFYDFLNLYQITGNMTETLNQLKLTITQIFSKKNSDQELNSDFKVIEKQVEDSKAYLARNRLRDVMLEQINQGYVASETFNRKVFKNPDGEIVRVVEERKIQHNPLPVMYYQEFMKQTPIEDAVSVLVEHDLLPPEVSKQILQYNEKLTGDIKKAFEVDKDSNKQINEEDLINILTDALGD
ncbi:MAG: hypothetical protein F6K34_01085 [Okeania sp. SIO4D6]|nr:hypothetical protein [Okeania sp. SIO4D6]